VDLEKLKQLIEILEESGLSELEMEEEGSRIRLQKPNAAPAPLPVAPPVHIAPPQASASAADPIDDAPVSASQAAKDAIVDDGLVTIDAPMVGVFYSSPSPEDDAFVKPGDQISVDQTICIVEAMKLMNEVTSKIRGEIVRVLVDNAEPVEFGQPLFAVRPLD
jgi:acetyl-CoA carboxylase biotin carboxyl carrier protein